MDITDSGGTQGWLHQLRDRYLRGEEQFATRISDAFGLNRFARKGGQDDIYFPIADDLEMIIHCSNRPESLDQKNFFSHSCRVKSNYKTGIALEYTYASKYLPYWRQIDTGLKTLFDRFEQAAATESAKEIKMIQDRLNHRPRKRLGFKTPHEVFHALYKPVALRT